jgi:uncharacterized membrane protein YkgB
MRRANVLSGTAAYNLSIVMPGTIPWYGSAAGIRWPKQFGRAESRIRKFATVAITGAQHQSKGPVIALPIMPAAHWSGSMDQSIVKLAKLELVRSDFDYHLMRVAMIAVFFIFSCQKWFDYEAQALIPFISHGPLIFWLYPAFGVRGATFFLGSAETLIGLVMLLGFWNRKAAILGALASCGTYVTTVTIIPFFPDAWAAPAGGFPAATLPFLFLVKDIVLLAASVYLLKQAILRAASAGRVPLVDMAQREAMQ